MAMIRKRCNNCGVECWHNQKKDGQARCTYCGYPASTNPGKAPHQREVMDRQVAKARAAL